MRDFSKVGPSVWKSRKFWKLPDDAARFAYLYFITCPHINSPGCYDLDPAYGAIDMKWSVEAFRKALQSIVEVRLVEFDEVENTIRVLNWLTFNEPTNPKHAMGMIAQLDQASSSLLKRRQLNDLTPFLREKGFLRDGALRKSVDSLSERLREDLREPIPTETETETQTKTESETKTKTEIKTETIRTENARDGDPDAAPYGASVSPRYQPPPMQVPASADRVASLMETPLMRRTAK